MGDDNIQAIFEAEEVERFLKQVKDKAKFSATGMKQLGGIISATVFQDIIDHFKAEEGPEGSWDDWSPSYSDFMERIGKGGNKILQNTGRLRNSFQPSNYRAQSGGVLFFNPATTSEGFPYAAAHDTGGKKLPQRKFMWMSKNAMEQLGAQTLEWLLDVR